MYSFQVLFILTVISSNCEGRQKNCDVVPKDLYIEVGSDAEIVCQSSCVHGPVSWKVEKAPTKNESKSVNSSYTVLSLRNFTHPIAGLQCISDDTKQVIGGTIIRTYSKPRKISCVWHYKNQAEGGVPELLTCSWEHQMDSSLKITYTVLCASWFQSSQREICSSHVTTCTSKDVLTSGKTSHVGDATVIVRAKTTYWEASSDPYQFNPFHILKMTRPKIDVTAFSNYLLVDWIRSHASIKCHCQVKCSKAFSDRAREWMLNKTLKPGEKGTVTVEKVESCTPYKVSVRCALDEAPWSDWSQEETILTKVIKSDVKLRLWRKVLEPGSTDVRKVHVMWTEIPSACQGTFTHSVRQTPYNKHMIGVDYIDTSCGNSTCDVNVNPEAHRLRLTVFHNEALLAEDSVYVPAIGEGLPQVTNVQASTEEGVITVSWKAPDQPVSGYMVDWTHDGIRYHWKESNYTKITLFDLLDNTPYNITVTPLFDDKTGLGTQVLWICSRLGGPGHVSIIDVQINNKTALVSWNMKSQEVCSGDVVNYTIFYGTQNEPQLSVTVDCTKQNVMLKDLNPDTQYSIYVKATALTGTSRSSEWLFKTKRFDSRFITTLSVCGSIIILLVLSLGLGCTIQWKKFSEKLFPDPGLSSVAMWASQSLQKPFSNPSESHCEPVYTEEALRTPTPTPATGCNPLLNPSSDLQEEPTEPAISLMLDVQNEMPVDPVEAPHQSSPGESRALLSSESSLLNPYQSQSCVETPALRTNKQCKHLLPVKHQEKTLPVPVYVTLDMFEQGQVR